MSNLLLFEVYRLISNNPELSKTVNEDIYTMMINKFGIPFEDDYNMEKIANSFRDMVAMGRTPKFKGMNQIQSFNRLRNTRMYMSYKDYNAFDFNDPKQRMQKRLYNASLRDDLKSIIRSKDAYKNFMENKLMATLDNSGKYIGGRDFTEKEYNDFFGNRTHYPSLDRVASGIIKGVENQVNNINNINKGKSRLPKLIIGNPRQVSNQLFTDSKSRGMKRNELTNKVNKSGGGLSYQENINDPIAITVAKNPLNCLRGTPNISFSDPRLLGKDNILAHKAGVINHEFNEALNELDFYRRNLPIDIKTRNKLSKKILGDYHMSGQVLGNDFIAMNRLYGSQVGSPIYLARALENMPTDPYLKVINKIDGSFMAQTAGLDYSSIDGGFGNFKSLKQLRRYLNKIKRNTNEFIRKITLPNFGKWKLGQNEYIELLTRFFPNMNLFQDYSFSRLIYKKLVEHLNNEYLKATNTNGLAN